MLVFLPCDGGAGSQVAVSRFCVCHKFARVQAVCVSRFCACPSSVRVQVLPTFEFYERLGFARPCFLCVSGLLVPQFCACPGCARVPVLCVPVFANSLIFDAFRT